eukprot:5523620-Amphidinium_carterae.1
MGVGQVVHPMTYNYRSVCGKHFLEGQLQQLQLASFVSDLEPLHYIKKWQTGWVCLLCPLDREEKQTTGWWQAGHPVYRPPGLPPLNYSFGPGWHNQTKSVGRKSDRCLREGVNSCTLAKQTSSSYGNVSQSSQYAQDSASAAVAAAIVAAL